ncbi:hypothetical protein BDZ89DRAFT_1072923 [Hymenopellis radicata]|nr:hypothetical protein BDZ89DRAFT_1072923 [Hymenopellis radicata]
MTRTRTLPRRQLHHDDDYGFVMLTTRQPRPRRTHIHEHDLITTTTTSQVRPHHHHDEEEEEILK